MLEQELINQLNDAEIVLKEVKKDIARLKTALDKANTNLVGAKKNLDELKESLRLFRNAEVKVEITQRDIDIADFRERFPELCDKDG